MDDVGVIGLSPRPVGVICARDYVNYVIPGANVGVPKPQRLPDPHPCFIKQADEEAIAQAMAGAHELLDLFVGQRLREVFPFFQLEHLCLYGFRLVDMMKEVLVSAIWQLSS